MRIFSKRGDVIFKANSPKKRLYHILLGQSVVVLLVSILWMLAGPQEMVSALLGGLVCVVPNLIFVEIFYNNWRRKNAQQIMAAFYVAELSKMLLTGVLAVILVKAVALRILPFMVGILTAYFGFWLVSGFLILRNRKRS